MLDKTKTYASIDLLSKNLLPIDWVDQVSAVSKNDSYLMKLDGKSSTSREPTNTKGVEVFVVEGDIVAKKLNWLHNLYQNEFVNYVNMFFEKKYTFAKNLKSGTNINLLKGIGARYEWHVDSNPLTGVLFVTEHTKASGGELVFKLPKEELIIYPKSGTLLLFDAREIPHTVLPLKENSTRISIPLNFYIKGEEQKRPNDLDEYIYKNK
jgi:hypothetical protein